MSESQADIVARRIREEEALPVLKGVHTHVRLIAQILWFGAGAAAVYVLIQLWHHWVS